MEDFFKKKSVESIQIWLISGSLHDNVSTFIVADDIESPQNCSRGLKWHYGVSPSVSLSTLTIVAPSGRIDVKFDIGDLYENVPRDPKIC